MKNKEMLTVNQVSEMTGCSVRTLHYYDEIGLLKPSELNFVGYRLYDDKALETLQQILFFKELDIPLKKISQILKNPHIKREKILQSQKELLILKRKHLNDLIKNIDSILKGRKTMDFTVFNQKQIEDFYESVKASLNDEELSILKDDFGSIDNYKSSFIKNAGKEKSQDVFAKMLEWNDTDKIVLAYKKRIKKIFSNINKKMINNASISDFETKALIGELDFILKQYLQLDDVTKILKEMITIKGQKQLLKQGFIEKDYGSFFYEYFVKLVNEFLA